MLFYAESLSVHGFHVNKRNHSLNHNNSFNIEDLSAFTSQILYVLCFYKVLRLWYLIMAITHNILELLGLYY